MTTLPPKTERKYELPPQGTHVARIVQFVHIGTIPELFQGAERQRNLVRYVFELPLETYEYDGVKKPHLLSVEYTLSLNSKANLRKVVESLEGRSLTEEEEYQYDVESLVGRECMVQVTHTDSNGKTYANVTNVMPLMKGMTCPEQVTPRLVFTYYPFDKELFDSLPEFLRKKIEKSAEYNSALILRGDRPEPVVGKGMKKEEIPEPDLTYGDEADVEDIPF